MKQSSGWWLLLHRKWPTACQFNNQWQPICAENIPSFSMLVQWMDQNKCKKSRNFLGSVKPAVKVRCSFQGMNHPNWIGLGALLFWGACVNLMVSTQGSETWGAGFETHWVDLFWVVKKELWKVMKATLCIRTTKNYCYLESRIHHWQEMDCLCLYLICCIYARSEVPWQQRLHIIHLFVTSFAVVSTRGEIY